MTKSGKVILITGGNGFLGQHLIKLLQERVEGVKEIRCVDLVPYVRRLDVSASSTQQPTTTADVVSFVGDICQPETIDGAFVDVDCVFHCAAYVDFQFPPDLVELERVNVAGTQNIINLCRRHRIGRLVFSSSAMVVLQPYMGRATFALLINQTESKAQPPADESGFLIPGYPASKLRAEKLVLLADGTPLAADGDDGAGVLRTVALRPTVMYGEADERFVPSLIKLAHRFDQRIPKVAGAGGKQQLTYVGNAAWAHIRAMHTLTRDPDAIGGLPVFISDDTPIEDTTRFCQRVSRAGRRQRLRLRPTWWSLPTMLTYFVAVLLELLVSWLVRPLMQRWRRHDWRLSFSPCALVAYGGSIILFSRLRAAIHLDYEPIFNETESILLSANWYEKWYDSRYAGVGVDGGDRPRNVDEAAATATATATAATTTASSGDDDDNVQGNGRRQQ